MFLTSLFVCLCVVQRVFSAWNCIQGSEEHTNSCYKDSPNDSGCKFDIEYSVYCDETCKGQKDKVIWGTKTYTYDSSLCLSALHDLRISSYNLKQRVVKFIRIKKDIGKYHDTIRQGVNSIRYAELSTYGTGYFYFTSPKIKEPLVDITSLHRRYLYQNNHNSVQECHLPSHSDKRIVHFSYYVILPDGYEVLGEKKQLTNHDYYRMEWRPPKGEVRKAIPGGVTCRLSNNDLSGVTSMTMRVDAYFRPARLTITASVGENVTLTMNNMVSCLQQYHGETWRKNGNPLLEFHDYKTRKEGFNYYFQYDSVEEGHAGVYSLECDQYKKNINGQRYDRRGVVRLIVRSCPAHLYGDDCNLRCPECQNGGVCHDILGVCICPPGFKGTNCEIPCGPQVYGKDCNKRCSDSDPYGSESCSEILFCLPDPYGCSCATGFKGLDCTSPCEDGTFGAGCTQKRECHCAHEQPCNEYTGLCHEGCDEGWKEDACITSYPFLSALPKLLKAGPNRLNFSFQAWDGKKGRGTPATYVVEMKEFSLPGTFHELERIDISTLKFPETRNVSLLGLKPNTEYVIRVVILDADGQAQRLRAPTAKFRTTCGKPKQAPYDLKWSSPNSRNVSLSWKIPDPETWQCSNVTVQISYNSSLGHNVHSTYGETYDFRSKPFTSWRIALRLETDNGKASDWVYFDDIKTEEDAPDVPHTLGAFFNPITESIYANWTKPLEANGIIRMYKVELVHENWQHSCKYPIPPIELETPSEIMGVVFNSSQIKYSSTYKVKVSAVTTKKGPPLIKHITLPESIPESAPINLDVLDVQNTSCLVRWRYPPCREINGVVSKFQLTYLGLEEWSSNDSVVRSSQIPSAQISDLIPFTNYELRVSVCTSMGCGVKYAEIQFKTLPSKSPSPRELTVFSKTTSSLSLTWKPPYPPYGIITQYIIFYEKKSAKKSEETLHVTLYESEVTCEDSEIREQQLCYTLVGLEPLTTYIIWVTAINEQNQESAQRAFVSEVTEESVPDPPTKIELRNRTTNSLYVTWREPIRSNGELQSYKINVTLVNRHGLQPIDGVIVLSHEVDGDVKSYNITELESASTYKVSVQAATLKGYGLAASELFVTKNTVPEVKVRPQVGKVTKDSVELLIKPILDYNGVINSYFVLVKDVTNNKRYKRAAAEFHTYNQSQTEYIAAKLEAKSVKPEGVNFTVGDGQDYGGFYNGPLQNQHKYIFGTAALSEGDGENQMGFSYLDEVVIVSDKSAVTPKAGIIIGTILAVIIIFGVFFLILYYKKPEMFYAIKGKGGDSFLMKNPKSDLVKENSGSNLSVNDMELYDDCLVRNSIKTNAIEIKDLEAYVQAAHISPKISQEYMSVGRGILHPSKVGKQAENKSKNRYGMLVPYDHSRVKLEKIEGDNYSDYINANYIEGYNGQTKYIATQGPKPLTVPDFWRMVWQENACKIIMVTNLVESLKTKCEKYWPDTLEKYGPFTITLVKTVTFADYVIRTLLVTKDDVQREIKQFHFTTWPDHGIPAYPVVVTSFLKQVRNYQTDSESPIVVHCSAGVGRTGTIILLSNMIDMARETNTVDPQHGLWSMRQCRVNLVETLEQYIFVYNALADYLCSGETSILCPKFRDQMESILESRNGNPSISQEQFERLKRLCPLPKFTDCVVAHEPENGHKNRIADILPPDRARAILPIKEVDQNSYINAVYVNGYKRNNAFIATQMPLTDTIEDFWRLIYSAKIRSIVLLHEFNQNDSTCHQYWEDGATRTYGDVIVHHVSSETQGTVLIRTFSIKDIHLNTDDIIIKQFHLQGWVSTQDTPEIPDSILELIEKAERWQKNTGARTLLVQCLNGASGCGVYCAATFVRDKIKTEQEVDVYLAVRTIRTNRPQFITNLNQYNFLHKVAIMYLDSFETYANFR